MDHGGDCDSLPLLKSYGPPGCNVQLFVKMNVCASVVLIGQFMAEPSQEYFVLQVHGLSYFRLEHYVPARVMEKLDLSYIKEELPKLHSTYVGASEKETELEFLKVSGQQLASFICDLRIPLLEYGCMDFK